MSNPPLNVDYWASLYTVYTDYAKQYAEAMRHDRLVDRAHHLWEWKGLNRSVPFEDVAGMLEQFDPDEYVDQSPRTAIEALSSRLVEQGIIGSNSLVTPAFLLHLAASGPDRYSVKFPIYDRRVWNAYVYLYRLREVDERLYTKASQSTDQYGAFCREFRQSCPDGKAREYERALFMFGGFITDLPSSDSPTSIATIDETLESQEEALTGMQRTADFALLDLDAIRETG